MGVCRVRACGVSKGKNLKGWGIIIWIGGEESSQDIPESMELAGEAEWACSDVILNQHQVGSLVGRHTPRGEGEEKEEGGDRSELRGDES